MACSGGDARRQARPDRKKRDCGENPRLTSACYTGRNGNAPLALKITGPTLAALGLLALPGVADASSFITLGAPAAEKSTPSIVMLGAPAAKPSATSEAAPAEADPVQTAALMPVASPSIILLGSPARDPAATDPTERDEADAVAEPAVIEEKPSRPDPMPIVMRGDFGTLRGAEGESFAVTETAPAATPAAASAGGQGSGAPADGSGDEAPSAGRPVANKPEPEPEAPLSPAELDR